MKKKWLTAEEAMVALGCRRTKLYELRRDHKLKWSREGRHIYILAASIDEMLDRNSSDFSN